MPWTETTQADYDRRDLRYASDLRAGEWAVIVTCDPELPPIFGRVLRKRALGPFSGPPEIRFFRLFHDSG